MRILVFCLVVMLVCAPSVAAQVNPLTGEGDQPPFTLPEPVTPPTSLTIVRGEAVRDLVDGPLIAVAPDASVITYLDLGDDRVCVVAPLPLGGVSDLGCSAPSDDARVRADTQVISPDGRYSVYHDNAAIYFVDSDLMLYDRDAGVVHNLTNDFFDDSLLDVITDGPPPGIDAVYIDYVPVWSHDSREIYFVRTPLTEDNAQTTGVYRVPVEGGTPTLIATIGTGQDYFYSIYASRMLQLDGAMSLSPSGRYLAAVQNYRDYETSVVTVIDVQTGTVTDVVGLSSLNVGLPDNAEVILLAGVDWLPDESGLLIAVQNPMIGWGSNVVQFILADETITPLVDLSDVNEAEFDVEVADSPRLLLPLYAGVLSDGSAIVWAGQNRGALSLWWAPLPLTTAPYTLDDLPASAGTGEVGGIAGPTSIGSAGNTVRVIFGGTVFTLLRRD